MAEVHLASEPDQGGDGTNRQRLQRLHFKGTLRNVAESLVQADAYMLKSSAAKR